MKYLKIILAFLALLFLVFILLGIFKPAVKYDCDIMVDKPLAESWQVTQDESKMQDWLEGFERIEHLSGTPGTVGSVANVHFVTNGQPMSIKETITEIVPNQSISMTYEDDFMNMDYTLSMSADGEKTKINSTTNATGNGMFSKSIMAMMGGTIKGQEEANLVNLKRVIEDNTKNYFPEVEEVIELEQK